MSIPAAPAARNGPVPTRGRAFLATVALLLAGASAALAMGTSFSYQGSLEDDGVPAHGSYDFEFRLIDSGGAVLGSNERADVEVVNGVFTVELDFANLSDPFPGPFIRLLEIGIRPAGSADPYQFLQPLTPINPVPYAQRAAGVAPGAIVSGSITGGAVTTSAIGTSAVTSTRLADGAVSSAKLATGAVSADKLASNAVSTVKIANGAVTNAKVAAGSLTMSRHAGVFFNGSIGSLTVGGNACITFDIPISGAVAGDFPLVALQAGASLPANFSLTALRVPSNGVVQLRACNSGGTTAGWTSLGLIFMTLR